jgi:excisionase family DNA binding protein
MNDDVPLLTVSEVALMLRQSAGSVYRKLESGDLPGIKLGSSPRAPWRVPAAELDRWLVREGSKWR